MNRRLAIQVGITALAMTVATMRECWLCVMILCERPNSAEMVPNVSPVDRSHRSCSDTGRLMGKLHAQVECIRILWNETRLGG